MEGEPHTSDVAAEPASMFAAALDRLASLTPALRREISVETATVLDAFRRANDPVGLREAMALSGLLGRRTAELGATAVELAAVVEALVHVVGGPLTGAERQAIRGLVIEGYTRGHIEKDHERALAARIGATRPFVVAPRCVALVLQGTADSDWIAGASEALGRLLLPADARAVLVVLHLDGDLTDAVLAEISALVDVACIVGARAILALDEANAASVRARVGDRASVLVDDVAVAFSEALSVAASSPTDAMRARVAGLLKRFGV